MGRAPCCDKANVKKGPWSPEEDARLKSYIEQHGTGGNWIALPQKIGLKRCGKSCRLRWLNYLRPNIKHGGFSVEEDNIICSLYLKIGSRWSVIAAQLPGRTDNDVKNYWNTKLKKKLPCLSSNPRQTMMKTENGNPFAISDMTWPALPVICSPNIISPPETNLNEDPHEESITKPLVKLGERVFYEDDNIDTPNIITAARSTSINSIKGTLSQGPNTHCSTAMSGLTFQQRLNDLDMELLDELLYGNYQQLLVEGSAIPESFSRNIGDHLSYLGAGGDSFSTATTGMACTTFYPPPSDEQLVFSSGAHDGSAHHQPQQMPIRNRAFGDESAYRCFELQ